MKTACAIGAIACLAIGATARAEIERADPLEVPTAAVPVPEDSPALDTASRVDAAAKVLFARGHENLPVLGWAALAGGGEGATARAAELAPSSPGVQLAVAVEDVDGLAFFRAIAALFSSFPALAWFLSLGGIALGAGLVTASLGVVLVGFSRTLALHGHVIGHATVPVDPPAWPGMLLGLAMIALLPLAGLGPLSIVGVMGLMATFRARSSQAIGIAVALAVLGGIVGPGLDVWSRLAAAQAESGRLLAAWRTERAQVLPYDTALLEREMQAAPGDWLVRIAVAGGQKRVGDLEGSRARLADIPADLPAPLRAAALNLRGIASLADGAVQVAIASFEEARAAEPSAPILFNLSQAYGRALRLNDQNAIFAEARAANADIVSKHTSADGTNVHHYLIQQPVPLRFYLQRALADSPAAMGFSNELRARLLGASAPWWAWMVLAGVGFLGAFLRRSSIQRCSRCEQPMCVRCSSGAATSGTCVRCERLFVDRRTVDARVRKEQMERDRQRQRRQALGLAGLSLFIPGAPQLYEGRTATGAAILATAGAGAALFFAANGLASPGDVGLLGAGLPLALGALCAVPVVLAAFGGAGARLARARSVR